MKPTKAIIPVAGYGTRRLPITKSIEKSMLPLLNRPIVDYVVEQCVSAGIKDIYFVISKGSSQLKSYYEANPALEAYLLKHGNPDQAATINPPTGVNFHYIEQDQSDEAYGTAVPVWLGRNIIEKNEKVLVIMGDQYLYREDNGSDINDLIARVEAKSSAGGMVVVPVSQEVVSQYGIVSTDEKGNYVRIIEKPPLEEAPSNLNNASIYLMGGLFWNYLEDAMKREHAGEYLITDALNAYAAAGNTVVVSEAEGKYLDCGTLEGWVEANNYLFSQTK